MNENNPLENVPITEVPPPNPTPAPALPPVPAPAPGNPPPAAELVERGTVRSERELALERRISELEDDQDRLNGLLNTPAPTPVPTPRPKKVKRKTGTLFFRSPDEIEEWE